MADISNKTLVSLLVIAIIISLAGTWISVGKLGKMAAVTGAPSGTVALEITIGREITLYYSSINFSSGSVNTSNNNEYCYMNTSCPTTSNVTSNTFVNCYGTSTIPATLCLNFSMTGAAQGFEIQNTGTLIANVTMNSSNIQWLNGTTLVGVYQYELYEEANISCAGDEVTSWTSMPNTDPQICGNLGSSNSSRDSFMVPIRVGVPRDLSTGAKSDTVTFTAIAAS